jgi:phenylalanyl-tRNA synthetase beta chain
VRLSFDWLLDFVDVADLTPAAVAEKLTMGAFEVEEIRKVRPEITGPVVVGEIVEINPHPNADKIRLTRVRVDTTSEPLEIVCGAGNIIVGQRIPVALPGARVINRHDGSALNIKQSKIRGAVSNGMLCSPPELGITDGDSEGILILPNTPALGTDIIELLRLHPDHVLHVGTRSNRGDALSVIGLAREVAALLDRPMREPKWQLPEPDETSDAIEVRISDTQDCPFFSLRVLQGLSVGPSPLKIIRRLEAIGVRPVNNVVDVTNYVLHELGQPLHAYDLAKLTTRAVDVRRARSGEQLLTIDGKERELSEAVLVVADQSGALGVAGVMGGKDSEITEKTKFVALEAASFHPARVRRASRLLGLASDSSQRFERGVDVGGVRRASDRAAALLLECCGGYLGRITSGGSDKVSPVQVGFRVEQLKRLTEIDLPAQGVASLLARLGLQSQLVGEALLDVSIPSFRQNDLTREIDLIEEACRMWGYDRIPASMPNSTAAPDLPDKTESTVRQALLACGLSETCTSSLTGVGSFGLGGEALQARNTVRVLNPLSEDHQVLRRSLLPGLVKAVAYNRDRGADDAWLFDVGHIYERTGESSQRETGVHEDLRAGGVLAGTRKLSCWNEKDSNELKSQTDSMASNFYVAKGVVENLLTRLNVNPAQISFQRMAEPPEHFHPGRCCEIRYQAGQESVALGTLGEVNPAISDKLSLRSAVALFELSLGAVRAAGSAAVFTEIPTTPSVVRDLTCDLPQAVDNGSVVSAIAQVSGPELREVNLVSVFRLSDDLKSHSYRLTFQHAEQTLTNEQVEQQLARVRQALTEQLSAAFRT